MTLNVPGWGILGCSGGSCPEGLGVTAPGEPAADSLGAPPSPPLPSLFSPLPIFTPLTTLTPRPGLLRVVAGGRILRRLVLSAGTPSAAGSPPRGDRCAANASLRAGRGLLAAAEPASPPAPLGPHTVQGAPSRGPGVPVRLLRAGPSSGLLARRYAALQLHAPVKRHLRKRLRGHLGGSPGLLSPHRNPVRPFRATLGRTLARAVLRDSQLRPRPGGALQSRAPARSRPSRSSCSGRPPGGPAPDPRPSLVSQWGPHPRSPARRARPPALGPRAPLSHCAGGMRMPASLGADWLAAARAGAGRGTEPKQDSRHLARSRSGARGGGRARPPAAPGALSPRPPSPGPGPARSPRPGHAAAPGTMNGRINGAQGGRRRSCCSSCWCSRSPSRCGQVRAGGGRRARPGRLEALAARVLGRVSAAEVRRPPRRAGSGAGVRPEGPARAPLVSDVHPPHLCPEIKSPDAGAPVRRRRPGPAVPGGLQGF